MKLLSIIFIIFFCLVSSQAFSAENWYWKGSGQLLLKTYSASTQLDGLTGVGVFLSGDYLERGGFTVGYLANNTSYKSRLSNAPFETNENILLLSGKSNFYSDQLPGRLTLRLDAYVGADDMRFRSTTSGSPMGGGASQKTTTVTDEFVVVNPIVSFLNYAKTFYADLGYAYSTYRSDDNSTEDINIVQWTPTLGVGFNRAYDWLQLRAYYISLSGSNRVGNTDETSALKAKWTHWFSGENPLGLYSARLSLLSGERIYAVDSDAFSVSNESDLQTGGLFVGMEWKLSEQSSVLLQGGYETYKNLLFNDTYSSAYLYAYMSRNW